MDLMTLPRTALSAYLAAIKWPIDTGLKLSGHGEGPASIALDRVDGTVRTVAGGVLGDEALQRDGVRRLTAADERTRALRLRAEAELRRERADEQLDDARAEAERQRRAAEERAEEQRRTAEREKSARTRQAAEAERTRKRQSEKAEAQVKETIERRAKRERLEQLEQRADALGKQDDALTAQDEAQRLAGAASAAKAARKRGS
jgi:hypothetical protein